MRAPATPSARGPGASGGLRPLVTPETARADLARAVRLAVLRDPALTLKALAADAGLAEKRLRRLIEDTFDRRYPRGDEMLSLWAALAARDPVAGAAAASASLATAGLRAEVDDAAPEPLAGLVADVAGDLTEFARAVADGGVTAANRDAILAAAARLRRDAKCIDRVARG